MRLVRILLLTVMAIVVLLAAVFIAAGLMIPAERNFTNEIEINASADTVWQVVNDRSKYSEWQPNLTRVEIVDHRNWIEYPKDSPETLSFSVVKDERPQRMELEYSMGAAMNGKWRGDLTQSANGVKLRTEDGYVAKGWMTKILIAAFFNMDEFAKDWNNKLKQRAESLYR